MFVRFVALITLIAGCSDTQRVPQVTLVGHSPLEHRGMNSAPAIIGDFIYIGSRTDGSTEGNDVLIVDASDPTNPMVVGRIGPPHQGLIGMSSRELRAIPDKNLLIVLNFACSTRIHACRYSTSSFPDSGGAAETDNLKFYDVSNPTQPALVATYDFGTSPGTPFDGPHEFFLWRDPSDSNRVLLYVAKPIAAPQLVVLDVSDTKNISVVADFDPERDAELVEVRGTNTLLHSVGVSADGTVGYISYQSAGLLIADFSDIAKATAEPEIRLLAPQENRIDYSPPHPPGTHSAVQVPNRDLVIVTDEVYAAPQSPGCPWGWARLIDMSNPTMPTIAGEYRPIENHPSFCTNGDGGPENVVYTAHNTTATPNLALITWYAGGLHIVDISQAHMPELLFQYRPDPLQSVTTEDPTLGGADVSMWSYPIIKDGLIYVTDSRNGLYILRYSGPHDREIDEITFREGNSNLQ